MLDLCASGHLVLCPIFFRTPLLPGRLMGGWPKQGDILGCVQLYNSVYEPRVLLQHEDLSRYKLLRHCLPLPYDLIEEYFGIRKQLWRVSNISFGSA